MWTMKVWWISFISNVFTICSRHRPKLQWKQYRHWYWTMIPTHSSPVSHLCTTFLLCFTTLPFYHFQLFSIQFFTDLQPPSLLCPISLSLKIAIFTVSTTFPASSFNRLWHLVFVLIPYRCILGDKIFSLLEW